MKVVFYMNCVSAHQLPLAKEIAKLVGAENFCYVDAGERGQEYQSVDVSRFQGFKVSRLKEGLEWLGTADFVLTGLRDLELFERRAKKGLRTYYTSERWFKPIEMGVGGRCRCRVVVPGFLRMVVPGYRRMVKRFVKWANEDPGARVLAIGPWAKKDFLRMGVRADKIVDWGYFVEASRGFKLSEVAKVAGVSRSLGGCLRVLWAGRMLDWKRVEDVIRAVAWMQSFRGPVVSRFQGGRVRLSLVGDGPEKGRLVRLAEGAGVRCRGAVEFSFLPSQPMEKVRELMREHDLYVLSSNGYEGWGAVVSEALEEGMNVIGTYESGAAATLLPKERLYHCGDWKSLAKLIEKEMRGELPPCSIGEWTAAKAAERLVVGF